MRTENYTTQFTVARNDETGTYCALREVEPRFMFTGKTASEVAQRAEIALNFYYAAWGDGV